MKKNKMMRLASVLLVCVLLTTSVISGTFAKYTTTGTASDTARVAKFGVAITTSGNLFSDAYQKQANGNTPATVWGTSYNGDNVTVATATGGADNLVAPGTKSYDTGLTFGVSGTPEVATQITATIKARDIYLLKDYEYGVMIPAKVNRDNFTELRDTNKLYTKTGSDYTAVSAPATYSAGDYYTLTSATSNLTDNYYPVVYKLDGETTATGTITASSTKAVADALTAKLTKTDAAATGLPDAGLTTYTVTIDDAKVYDANTNLATAGPKLGGEKLTWAWAFESTPNMDSADTVLGDMIAALGVSGTPDYYVVAKATSGPGNYADVKYDKINYLAKDGSDNIIASLKTSFDIELTVTQVD